MKRQQNVNKTSTKPKNVNVNNVSALTANNTLII